MPTVLRSRPYRSYFYSHEPNEPPHIHVEKDNAYAKYWLDSVDYADSYAFRAKELTQIRKLVEENQQLFLEKWNEFFSK